MNSFKLKVVHITSKMLILFQVQAPADPRDDPHLCFQDKY